MPRVESWETVAKALGERMQHQSDQCMEGLSNINGEVVGPMEDVHRVRPDAFANECAHCADTVAYRRYVARRRGIPYVPREGPYSS